MGHDIKLVIHAGAWNIPDDEKEAHLNGLRTALECGWKVLKQKGSAVDAVEAAVVVMEDDPTFDAGRGSILNMDGSIEMDASIMDGKNLEAGGVAALRNFPNPVKVARKVMEETDHVLLAGEGCEAFARKMGFQPVPIKTLLTSRELKRLEALMGDNAYIAPYSFGEKRGTVGAVAIDREGNIAAATSTGGTPKKIPGRVGDSPLIGCGTYAENGVGGVSCTGWGEAIIKTMLARRISDAMAEGNGAQAAVEYGIQLLNQKVHGLGGAICIDSKGNIGIAFNTPRMARAYMDVSGEMIVSVE